jgi:uncharacterized protein (TIGR01319 family)
MRPVLSFDIGSTYTKGALFDLDPRQPMLLRRDSLPTTVSNLADGFAELQNRLAESLPADESTWEEKKIPIFACSSAKGGLAIAALGLVPDLTLHVAKLAAASAGGKIIAAYAYRLTDEQLDNLKRTPPDVILFSGGTDGGNEDYVLRNARTLADARLPSVVLYAGNAALAGEIRKIFCNGNLCVTENIMPEIGKLNNEPARAKIQEIFLQKIVEGKGLNSISSLCAGELKPTPRAVFDLLEAMSEKLPRWNDSVLLDLGGATTDFYSCTESFRGDEGFILKGLREPKLKRTVEGDLGLRVSARSTWETGREYIERQLSAHGLSQNCFSEFIAKVAVEPEYLPSSEDESRFDEILAEACVYHSLRRHAGTIEESYTSNGKVYLQQGKDLRGVSKWILSGGYLSKQPTAKICEEAIENANRDASGLQLLPRQVEYYADTQYILPLIGNLVTDFPEEATRLADENLFSLQAATPSITT